MTFSRVPPHWPEGVPPPEYPARLIRFVKPGGLNVTSPWIVAVYVAHDNLMLIDKELFDKLEYSQQTRVMFSRALFVEVIRQGVGPPKINEVFTSPGNTS